jgi:hypothetical protein
MQRFGMRRREFGKIILCFSLYNTITFAMNIPVVLQESSFQAKKVITIFDSKKTLETGRIWNEIVPGHILITPDEKGVVISDHGRVRYGSFDAGTLEVIIKHHDVGNIPLIATAQKQDGSLLVVSAGNYHSKQEDRFVAEYAVYSNGDSRFHNIDFPIQAISLNTSGDILAIAELYSVMVIDLNTNKKNKATFKHRLDAGHWIVDIAINPKGDGIIVAGNHGDIQWMSYDEDALSNIKQVKTSDKIKKIYYPRLEDLLYVTDQGEAKIGKIDQLIEIDNDQILDTVCFAKLSTYDNVVADLSEQVAVACWTHDIKMDQDTRQKIKIYRKDDTRIDKFILKLCDWEESYNYRTLSGTCDSGVGHLLHVAFRGKSVAALATDGTLYLWPLPEKNVICNEVEKKDQDFRTKLEELKAASRAKEKDMVKRKRSNSGSSSEKVRRQSLGDTESGDKPKKVSPRFIHLLSKGSYNSKENSSASSSSRDNSPSQSPHRPENRIDNRAERSEVIKDFKSSGEDK